MATDTALIEKREELKYRLAAGEYQTLVDVIFAVTDRLIRKITRRPELPPIWVVAVILMITLTLISFMLLYSVGDMVVIHDFADALGLDFELGVLIMLILPSMISFIALVLINQYIGRIFIFWRDNVIDATESLVSLNHFEDWLGKICNRKLHLLVTIVLGLLGGLYNIRIVSTYIDRFVGYGITFTIIFITTTGITFFYLFLMVILLSARLQKYDMKLFAADPANSELLSRLSDLLSIIVYFVSAWAAYFTVGIALVGLGQFLGLPILLLFWIPIIAMFILNQISLSKIILRAKWRTLNEIQAKVDKLQATENYADKETMDTINRLMDYHDRVKKTRNSAIDLSATLHFINSLLLPLLAFILGNLDLVRELFGRTP